MSVPPDEPTRRLPPSGEPLPPVAAAPRVVGRDQVIADEAVWRQSVIDRLGGLRTGLTLVGLVATLALALAVWTFLRERQDRRDRGGGQASSGQLRTLRSRVDTLESQVANRATKTDLAAAEQSRQDLSKQVDDLAAEVAKPASTTDAQARRTLDTLNETVTTLDQSVKALDDRVTALEAQPAP